MSGGFLGRITRRIGRALVAAGLGAPNGGAPPIPPTTQGCIQSRVRAPASILSATRPAAIIVSGIRPAAIILASVRAPASIHPSYRAAAIIESRVVAC